jgi:SAM-dependent methyltransferase
MRLDEAKIPEMIGRYLACPQCHGALKANGHNIGCVKCEFTGSVRDGVVLTRSDSLPSFFDDKHQVMRLANQMKGNQELFYTQQARRVEQIVRPGAVLLDVGCGPAVPYDSQSGWVVIGLDPSFESVRSNDMVNLRVYGTAEAIPVPDHSVDAVACFYSIHHMTGPSVSENRRIVRSVFHEFGRAIRPGGNLLIFDLNPLWPFSALENVTWNIARRNLGPKLDMFFWEASRLADLGREIFPQARLEIEHFKNSPFITFPPVFNMPSLRIPRLLYPFEINLYNWQF